MSIAACAWDWSLRKARIRSRASGGSCGDSPAHYAMQMRELELTVRELLVAAQQERKVKLHI